MSRKTKAAALRYVGMSAIDIAWAFGISLGTVYSWLKVADAPSADDIWWAFQRKYVIEKRDLEDRMRDDGLAP